MIKFSIGYPLWYLVLCLLAGLIYAWGLYANTKQWGKNIQILLSSLRFVTISILCFLLLQPFLKLQEKTTVKPIISVLLDNSESMLIGQDSTLMASKLSTLSALFSNLREQGIECNLQQLHNLNRQESFQNIVFNNKSTNLSKSLTDIYSNYTNSNIKGLVIISDGIYNEGSSPLYEIAKNIPIFTLCMGDTISKKDLNIKKVIYNKTVYKGNKFPVLVEVSANGCTDEKTTISITENGKLLASKEVFLSSTQFQTSIEFILPADSTGKRHLIVNTTPLPGEITNTNNSRNIYVDVIDSKEKILLLAGAPHPDIAAIRDVIDRSENYDLSMQLLSNDNINIPKEKFDLIILYQVPSKHKALDSKLIERLKSNQNLLFFLGASSDMNTFNTLNPGVEIKQQSNAMDLVTGAFHEGYDKINFSDEVQQFILKSPPVFVHFGEYSMKGNVSVIIDQKIGNTVTGNPLLLTSQTQNRKTAVFCGEGIWKWRSLECQQKEKPELFTEFLHKIIKYLSMKEDKRKFKIAPISTEFFESENVLFETTTLSDINEPVYGKEIKLELFKQRDSLDGKGDQKTFPFSFMNSETYTKFDAGKLNHGIYKYKASTFLNDKTETFSGGFVIKKMELEELNLVADHALLNNLSMITGGKMFWADELEQLKATLMEVALGKEIIYLSEKNKDLVHWKWLFFILLILIGTEWFVRKYKGGY